MTFRLTEEDVKNLLAEPSEETRTAIANKVALNYATEGVFDAEEMKVAEHIFSLLVNDTALQVRGTLAQHLKDSNRLPRDILLKMAEDEESVSLPILQFSRLLNDTDLLRIIRNSQDISKHLAIARREKVSPTVSQALVDTRQTEVVGILLENDGAQFYENTFREIIEDFAEDDSIIHRLVQRGDLPLTTAEKLISLVSDELAEQLERKYNISSEQLGCEIEQSREMATLRLLDNTVDQEEIDKLISQMMAFKRLTPSIILTALCRGNIRFFETSMARLAKIPVPNARTLIHDRGELGFKSLYRKAELPESLFDAVRIVLQVIQSMPDAGVRPGSIHFANRVVERIFQLAEAQEVENISYIIALIRQNATR
jgi:uncharacterized protein (DUF2336 family)